MLKVESLAVRKKLLLALIIIAALALRLIFFIGSRYGQADPFCYWNIAAMIMESGFNSMFQYASIAKVAQAFAFRFSVILPNLLFFSLFGVSEFSAHVWPLICSLGEVVLIFYLGRLLFDEDVGILAAGLLAFYPIHVVYSTVLTADLILSFFLGLSVFCFLKGLTEETKKILYYGLSGFFIFLAYTTKAYAPLIYLVLLCFIFLYKKYEKLQLIALVSFLFLIVLLYLYYYVDHGSFLFHWQTLKRYSGHKTAYLFFYLTNLFPILTGRNLLNESGAFPYLALMATIVILLKKHKPAYPVISWLLILGLYMEFGSMSLTSYRMMHKEPRYLLITTLPLLLISAYFLCLLYKRKLFLNNSIWLRCAPAVIGFFLLVSSIYCIQKFYDDVANKEYNQKFAKITEVGAYLNSRGNNKAVNINYIPSASWRLRLPYYLRYRNSIKLIDIKNVQDYSQIKDAYILIDEQLLQGKDGYGRTQKFSLVYPNLVNPPETWRVVLEASDSKLYYAP